MQKFKNKTIVITGASSGLGKAIALTLAEEGANLVLSSRRESILQEVASECDAHGGVAIAIRADVTKFKDMQNLVEKALDQFGFIDVWINNAGVLAAGEFTDTPLEVHEQVIKVNLLGPLHGTYAILPYFKQKNSGTIINTVSLGAYVPNPYSVAYSASKFGLRGLNDSLRFELNHYPEIHVCDLNPAFIDTPRIEHAANFTGAELVHTPPLIDPFKVAEAVVSLIEKPRASIIVGEGAKTGKFVHALFPNIFGKSMAKLAESYFSRGKRASDSAGNLFSSSYVDSETRGHHH
jgi:short-subunit dehydrogenase